MAGASTQPDPSRERDAARRAREARRRASHEPASGPKTPRRRPGARTWTLLGLLAIPLVWLAVVGVVRATHSGQVLPGTVVDGRDLSGMTRSEAEDALTDAVIGRDVRLTIAGKPYDVQPADVAFRYDVEATIDRVMDAGRTGPVKGLVSTVTGLVGSRDITAVRGFDLKRLNARAREIAQDTQRGGSFGAIRIDADGLQAEPVAPKPGRAVDTLTVAAAIRTALRTGDGDVVVPIERVPTVSEADVAAVAEKATQFLTQPVTLTGTGITTRELQPREVGQVLALERVGETKQVRLGVDREAVAKLVAEVAASRDKQGTDARISVPLGGTRLTEQGSVSWRQKSVSGVQVRGGTTGRRVEQAAAVTAVAAAIRAGEHSARLPVKKVSPPVSETSAKRVDHLIGTFTTPFVGGLPRVTNITRMAKTIDGTVIAPGAQFSLNGIVGERTTAKGYVKAPYIAEGNKLEDSIGGGVSQVSTTMYNAAYFAGLQLDTHTPHSFYIDRYPAGRESTLNFGSIDLQWTNDTDTPVVVRTSVGPDSITVSLYGDNGGRKVRSEVGPRDAGSGGAFTIVVTRKTTYADGRVKDEPYRTAYGVPGE